MVHAQMTGKGPPISASRDMFKLIVQACGGLDMPEAFQA
jgi:hypothetical protein